MLIVKRFYNHAKHYIGSVNCGSARVIIPQVIQLILSRSYSLVTRHQPARRPTPLPASSGDRRGCSREASPAAGRSGRTASDGGLLSPTVERSVCHG